jgi:DNA-binding response OmpR family regulator
VFVVPESDVAAEQLAFDLGAVDVVGKPFKPTVVQARIQSILNSLERTAAEIQAISEHWRAAGKQAAPESNAS